VELENPPAQREKEMRQIAFFCDFPCVGAIWLLSRLYGESVDHLPFWESSSPNSSYPAGSAATTRNIGGKLATVLKPTEV
jgi:hypothetical protein